MKINKIINYVIFFFCALTVFGQQNNKLNAYLDALDLVNIYERISKEDSISKKDTLYAVFEKKINQYGEKNEICNNPFLKDFCLSMLELKLRKVNYIVRPPALIKDNFIPNILSSLPSANWQASAITGLANFMAGRFKQEVLQMGIDKVFSQITGSEDSIVIKALFPKAFQYLVNLRDSGKSSYYTADLLLLRQTVQIEIEQLPNNIIKNPKTVFPKMNNETIGMLALCNQIINYSKIHSLDRLLSLLSDDAYQSDTLKHVLNTMELISCALMNPAGEIDPWKDPKTIQPIRLESTEKIELRIFYGLLYQQLINAPISGLKNYMERLMFSPILYLTELL